MSVAAILACGHGAFNPIARSTLTPAFASRARYYTDIIFTGPVGSKTSCWTLYISTPGYTMASYTKCDGVTPAGVFKADAGWKAYMASCLPVYPDTIEVVAI